MGLAFLNKKSWHTGSFKNIADVWSAQEKAKEQQRKREEIKKKVMEEKYSEDLKKMQVEAGLLPKSALDRMEWMHSIHDNMENKNSAEEYLLGKPVQSLDKVNQTFQEDALVNEANEDFVRLQEDPLFQMQKEKERRKQEMINNPVKMEMLIKQMASLQKEKKKKKKDKHKSRSRSRSPSRDRKKDKKHHKKDKKKSRRRSSSESSRSTSQEREEKHKRNKDKKKREKTADKSTTDDTVFSEQIRKRLGPLVEFDEETYKFKFLAKEKFKNNDPKKMTPEERDKMLEKMKRNAAEYEEQRYQKYTQDTKEDDNSQGNTGGFMQKAQSLAFDTSGKGGLSETINRSKYFHDKKLARGDS